MTQMISKIIGIFLVIFSFLLTPWLMEFVNGWAMQPIQIDPVNKIFIIFFQIYLLTTALSILLKNGRFKRICKIYFVIITSILVALIPFEVYMNYNEGKALKVMPSREYHHYYPPGSKGYEYARAADEKTNHITINELGMRGDLPKTPKQSDEYRILILGDSFIYAGKLEYRQTMGPILEKLINNPHVHVLTHGIPSWSPLLELNWLIKNLKQLKPDLVILVLCENDFFNFKSKYGDSYYKTQTIFGEQGLPIFFKLDMALHQERLFYNFTFPKIRYLVSEALSFIKNSRQPRRVIEQREIEKLFTMTQNELEAQLDSWIKKDYIGEITREMIRLARPWQLWDSKTSKNVELSLLYIKLLNEYLKKNSINLIITMAPFGWSVAADECVQGKMFYGFGKKTFLPEKGIEQKIHMFCNNSGIIYFELPKILRKYRITNSNHLYFSSDSHWNATGHQLIAHELYEFLNDKISFVR